MDASPLRRHLLAMGILLSAGSVAAAQQWATDMFNTTSHDFGTVARAAKVEFDFVCENIYEEPAHIREIRSTCGCTTTKISQRSLKTWEKAVITATVDTLAYFGQKESTLTVVFDEPFPAEVRLNIHCYIRSDVVVHPGVVEFGTVTQGAKVQRKLKVNYAGRSDWRIRRIENSNPYLDASVTETGRANGQVEYDLLVGLKEDAPVGYIRDHIMLVTNDSNPRALRVPVLVEGIVASPFTVRPSPLLMGVVPAGKPVPPRKLVVQGQKPFRIVSATSDDKRFKCSYSGESKAVQLLFVTFTPDATSGKVSSVIHIKTDQAGTIDVAVHIQVVPPDSGGSGPLQEPPHLPP